MAASGKLDQSLDDILKTERRTGGLKVGRGRGGRRGGTRNTAAAVAPVGGIKKNAKQAKSTAAIPTGPAIVSSKVQISNLPTDPAVNERSIKEYFDSIKLPVKRVEMSYGPGGKRTGVCNVIFKGSDSATKAVAKCQGVVLDGNKAMKIDVILDGRQAAALPPPKGLSDRITMKVQPKSAAPAKSATASTRGGKTRAAAKKTRAARPAKKTAAELDSEMADYWENNAGANGGDAATTNGASNGDANMDEEIL